MNKKRVHWAALLCALLLVACVPFAHAAEEATPDDSEQRAVEMLFQAYFLDDAQEQELLLLQAVQTAPDSPFILLECGQFLSMLNTDGKLSDTVEQILLRAKSIATGELREHTLRALGDHYLQTQSIDAARIFIEEEIANAPGDLTLQVMLAKVHYYGGQTDMALSILEEVLEDTPQALEAANLRALLLCELARWDEAIEAFHQIERQFPDSPEALNGRYTAYIATGQFDLAVRAINEEIHYTRDESLWMVRLNVRLLMQRDPEGALSEAEALIKAHPDWVDAHIARMNALIMLNRFEEAMDAARQVSTLNEPLSKALEGLTLLSFSHWDEAKEMILPALSEPQLQMLWADAALLYLRGYDDIDSATGAIVQSLATTDNQFYSFLRLGDLNTQTGNLLEAARSYYHAEQHARNDPQAMQMLVSALADAGRREDAQKYLAKMEERYPGWYETMIARIIYEDVFGTPEAALLSFVAMKEKFPFPASQMQFVEASLLLATGDTKGEKLIDDWLNQKDPESLTISDWTQYAQALQSTGNVDKLNDALTMAEACLAEMDPARVNDIRRYQATICSYRAAEAQLSGDMEACVQWLVKACDSGATLLTDTLEDPDGNPYLSETYDELYRQHGPGDEPWDVTVMPSIPK